MIEYERVLFSVVGGYAGSKYGGYGGNEGSGGTLRFVRGKHVVCTGNYMSCVGVRP